MIKRVAATLLLILAGLTAWTQYDRVGDSVQSFDATIKTSDSFGVDQGAGNLVGIQPWMVPADYANAATLEAKLAAYFEQARQGGWLQRKTIVVLPEYIGTWLTASHEKRSVYDADNLATAMQILVLSHLPGFVWHLAHAPVVADPAKWALFTLKSEQSAREYQQVFGNLSRRFSVHVVAGSTVLADPMLQEGRLLARPGGALYNVSALFDPAGNIVAPLVVKAFPIADELPFIAAGAVDKLPVFDTPAGKLGILICADSWYPASYSSLEAAGAKLLAVPSYSSGDNLWATRWGGYNGAATPADVDTRDIGQISEGDAWMKYAMAGRARRANIDTGLNVFLRGKLWDIGSDGATLSVSASGAQAGTLIRGATLTNLWLQARTTSVPASVLSTP